jgi:hypothetical protein
MIEHVGTQAQAAKLQAEHMASSERPWVLVEKFGEPLFSDGLERPEMFASMAGTPQAVVDFKLAGSTVARIIGVDVRFHLVPQKGELLQPDLPDEPVYIESSSTNRSPDSAFVKAPGQIVSLPIRLESGYVTAEQLTSISQGALYPCVYGRIRYLDSFVSTPHETRFCFIYRLSYGRTFYSNATGKQSIPNRFHEGDGPSVYTRYT